MRLQDLSRSLSSSFAVSQVRDCKETLDSLKKWIVPYNLLMSLIYLFIQLCFLL